LATFRGANGVAGASVERGLSFDAITLTLEKCQRRLQEINPVKKNP
jgi:hypothetical protein